MRISNVDFTPCARASSNPCDADLREDHGFDITGSITRPVISRHALGDIGEGKSEPVIQHHDILQTVHAVICHTSSAVSLCPHATTPMNDIVHTGTLWML
eukprot:2764820-Rhodomonas_salina.1